MTKFEFADVLWRLAGVLALVLANGFFVAAEFSIVTVRKTRIDQLVAEGHRGARAVRRAVTNPDSYIAATQLGITMASLGLGWIGEPALAVAHPAASRFLPATLAETTAHSVAVADRVRDRDRAAHRARRARAEDDRARARGSDGAARRQADRALHAASSAPFIRLLNGAGQAVVRALGLRSRGGHAMVHSEEELKMLVTASQEAGVLEEGEEQMLHRVFGFADLTAGQVMVPRTELDRRRRRRCRARRSSTRSRAAGTRRVPVYRDEPRRRRRHPARRRPAEAARGAADTSTRRRWPAKR